MPSIARKNQSEEQSSHSTSDDDTSIQERSDGSDIMDQTSKKKSNKKMAGSSEEEFIEEDDGSDSDEDSEDLKPLSRSSRQRAQLTAAHTKNKRGRSTRKAMKKDVNSDSCEDEEEQRKPRAKRSPLRTKPSSNRTKTRNDSSSENDESDESIAPTPRKKSGNSPAKVTKATGTAQLKDLSDDSSSDGDEHALQNHRLQRTPAVKSPSSRRSRKEDEEKRSSPIRLSALKAHSRLINYKDEEVDPEFLPKRKKKDPEDEEYQSGDDEEEEDSEEADDLAANDNDSNSADDDENDDDDEVSPKGKVGRVRDDDIGTADESSGDDKHQTSPRLLLNKSPRLSLDITIEPRLASQSHFDESSDSDISTGGRPVEAPPEVPRCKSTNDAITDERLPTLHICYFPPDGKNCQCFSLETMRKIALATNRPTVDDDGKRTFLQPPHFRSKISADLQDQIASRFGREALDINGVYYKHLDDIQVAQRRPVVDDDFMDAVHNYVSSTMGSRDLYCCPLCYTVAYSRVRLNFKKQKLSKKSSVDERYSTEFDMDPMSILNALSGPPLELASTFCFSTAAKTKKHLREDHGVDTKVVRGNALYERFQIRKQDGLLQRYIGQSCRSGTKLHGFILQYWRRDGNNLDFVLLLELVDLAGRYREVDGLDDDEEQRDEQTEAIEYFEPAIAFMSSFADDATELWEIISGPYRNSDDLGEFLANDDEEVVEGESARSLYRDAELEKQEEEMDDVAEKVARYQELEQAEQNDSVENGGDSEATSDESSRYEDDEEAEDSGNSAVDVALQDSDDESDDSWVKEKQKGALGKLARKRRSKEFHRTTRTSRASLSPEETRKVVPASVGKRKRLSIEDSDDDE